MVDIANRVDLEAQLARRLGREFEGVRRITVELLGDPPDLTKLTPQVYAEIERGFAGALLPSMRLAFSDTIEAFGDNLGYAFDMTLANERAAAWARDHALLTARGLNQTSQRLLQQIVSDYFLAPTPISDTRQRIAQTVYNARRVETIAQTEITRASVQGELSAVRDLEQSGIRFKAIWNTNNDSLTCPRCGPLNQVDISTIGDRRPPLHARCRCWINHEVVTDDSGQG